MLALIVFILLTASFSVIFKLFDQYKLNTFQAIVVNYWVCVFTGSTFFLSSNSIEAISWEWTWGKYAIFLGMGFIGTFYLIALVSQKISIAMGALASKTSLVIPVFFSLFFLSTPSSYKWYNYIGLGLAIFSIVMSSLPKKETKQKSLWLIPIVFLLTGSLDSLINYSNGLLTTETQTRVFPLVTFFSASIVGTIILVTQLIRSKEKVEMKNIIGGISLGVPNYFSIYFLLKALQHFENNGAWLYPVANISIIIITGALGFFLFKEQLDNNKKLGIGLAILAIILYAI
ncbi:MAG: hypothetical protein GY827_12230 [Cytophagales bacterium]|nr:hypothetical protein [Cytophagales bacterium]